MKWRILIKWRGLSVGLDWDEIGLGLVLHLWAKRWFFAITIGPLYIFLGPNEQTN